MHHQMFNVLMPTIFVKENMTKRDKICNACYLMPVDDKHNPITG